MQNIIESKKKKILPVTNPEMDSADRRSTMIMQTNIAVKFTYVLVAVYLYQGSPLTSSE